MQSGGIDSCEWVAPFHAIGQDVFDTFRFWPVLAALKKTDDAVEAFNLGFELAYFFYMRFCRHLSRRYQTKRSK